MVIADLTLSDALSVCERMRPRDRECVDAICGPMTAEEFAAGRWRAGGPAWSIRQDGAPVIIGGLSDVNDWIAVLWLVATPSATLHSWRKAARVARTLLEKAADPSFALYRHRVEAHCLAGWREAGEFVRRLGMRLEGRRFAVGRRGESVDVWVQIAPPKEKA